MTRRTGSAGRQGWAPRGGAGSWASTRQGGNLSLLVAGCVRAPTRVCMRVLSVWCLCMSAQGPLVCLRAHVLCPCTHTHACGPGLKSSAERVLE